MTVASNQKGTTTPVVGTETVLGVAIVTAGTFIMEVDTTNMVNGDVVELRARTKVLSTGTEKYYILGAYANIQADPVKMSIPIPSAYSVTFTIKQSAGVAKAFDWNLLSL
jgi:hypothetical protein